MLKEDNYRLLKDSSLFDDFSEDEIKKVFHCFVPREMRYQKNRYVLSADDENKDFVLILEGRLFVIYEDSDGDSSVLTERRKGDIAGISLIQDEMRDNIGVIAAEDSRVLRVSADTILWGCGNGCDTHRKLLYNLVKILSRDNLELMCRVRHISRHSLRKKIVSYLREQQQLHHGDELVLPFDRQEMAEYLGADRSALSAELSKMKREGRIDYRKNRFLLKDGFDLE